MDMVVVYQVTMLLDKQQPYRCLSSTILRQPLLFIINHIVVYQVTVFGMYLV